MKKKKNRNELNIVSIMTTYSMALNTELDSPLVGKCYLIDYSDNQITIESVHSGKQYVLNKYGMMEESGCMLVFPSFAMTKWDKLLWTRGCVLINRDGELCAFDGWTNGCHWSKFEAKYIHAKDFSFTKIGTLDTYDWELIENQEAYERFYEAVDKLEGKMIDRNTLEPIEDKPKFKTFDRVLVRNSDTELWEPGFFGMYDKGREAYTKERPYMTMNGNRYSECVAYDGNEGMAYTDVSF